MEEKTYKVKNSLDNLLNLEVGKRMFYNGGIKVTKKKVIGELAEYCGVGWENMNRIKRNLVTPSLPVALRIAEYFDKKVEEIFEIK
jgi:DNA-binding XRE family transcriptional regulator